MARTIRRPRPTVPELRAQFTVQTCAHLEGLDATARGFVVYGHDLVCGGLVNLGSYADAGAAVALFYAPDRAGYVPSRIVAQTATNFWGKA